MVGAGDDSDGVAVDVEPEAVVVGGVGDDFAGVDHADLDPLGGDHDLPALGYPALHYDGPRWWRRAGCCPSGAAQQLPVA